MPRATLTQLGEPDADGLLDADAPADGLALPDGATDPDGDGSGATAGRRSIGSVRMRRYPPGSSVTTTFSYPRSSSAAVISAADGSSAYLTSHSVPPVKSIEGFRPPRMMKSRPGIVRTALIAKNQLRLPTMSYIGQRST